MISCGLAGSGLRGLLIVTAFLAAPVVSLTLLSPPQFSGTKLRAPIPEVNAFAVLEASGPKWGRVAQVVIPSDESGCTAVGKRTNVSNSVVLVMDGGGCSVESKARTWQNKGALALIVVVRFQWVSDLLAMMRDRSNVTDLVIPVLLLKYGVSWRDEPTVDWGLELWNMVKNGTNVMVRLDFPDRQEVFWDLRTGQADSSALLQFGMLFWSVFILCITSVKLTLMLERSGLVLNVTNVIFMLDMVSAFLILLAGVFGPYFSSGYFMSEPALFLQTFYLPWVLSANTLLSFYWLEVTFFVEHTGASIKRLFWPTVCNCISLFALDLTRDILLACNADPLSSYLVSVIGYAVLGPYELLLLLFAVYRVLTRVAKTRTSLAKSAKRLATWMFISIFAGLVMLGGLIVYSVFEFHRWMTTMFLNIFLLQGGALLLMTCHNLLFEMKTQRQIVEMGLIVATRAGTSISTESDGPPSRYKSSSLEKD